MAFAASNFEAQDANSDGNISKDEFFGSVSDVGIYSDWDYDFVTWDVDGNSYLDGGEVYDGYFSAYSVPMMKMKMVIGTTVNGTMLATAAYSTCKKALAVHFA